MLRSAIGIFFFFSLLGDHLAVSHFQQMRIFSQLYSADEDHPKASNLSLLNFTREQFSKDALLVKEIHKKLTALVDSLPSLAAAQSSSGVYSTDEEDSLRGAWLEILNYRSILLRMMARYEKADRFEVESDQERSLLLNFGSSILLHHTIGRIIIMARNNPMAWRKFNEGDLSWNLRNDLLFGMMKSMGNKATRTVLENALVDYRQMYPKLKRFQELDWLHQIIEDGFHFFRENSNDLWQNQFELFFKPIKDFFYKPYYYLAATISTWISEFQYRKRPPLITSDLLGQLLDKLEPGDLVLERRHFYLTNVVLPGYWPHVVMYVGTRSQIHELGLLTKPELQNAMLEIQEETGGDSTHFFVDAQTYGVALTTEKKRLQLDSVAVLRPRVPLSVKRQAIWRALNYVGKPYDFEFDFFSADKIVCSEVIYRAYGAHLNFPLSKILGRMTLPPVNIANTFVNTRAHSDRPLDFILFFKGDPYQNQSIPVDEDEFVRTMVSGENPLSPKSSANPSVPIWP